VWGELQVRRTTKMSAVLLGVGPVGARSGCLAAGIDK